MDINTLKAELEAKNQVRTQKYLALKEHITKVIESNIDTSVTKVIHVSDSCAEIGINGSRSKSFTLYFHAPYRNETRKLELNFGCFGSFKKDDVDCIHYCEVLGHVAGIMAILEEKMITSPEAQKIWNEYDNAMNDIYVARSALDMAMSEERDHARELKKTEILQKIAIGTKVMVQKPTHWNPDGIVKTVEHITGKNIIFKEDYGKRTKKDDLVQEFIAERWTIA